MKLEDFKKRVEALVPGQTGFQVDWFLEDQLPSAWRELLTKGAQLKAGGPARLIPGRACECHQNAKQLVSKHRGWKLFFGLALSEDGIWRVHSWAENTRGRIIETTVSRTHYWGLRIG